MKSPWGVLLALSALALLLSIGGKLVPAQHLLGFLPGAWWKLAMALAVLAMAGEIVVGKKRPAA